MKILLPTDGSAHSRRVVAYLIRNRAMFGDQPEIHLLNAHAPLPGRAAAALSRAIVQRYYRDAAKKALAAARRALDRRGIAYREVRLVGEPGAAIAAYARRGKFSLVIMGSHGQGALRNLVLGSVANKVLANCKAPVLLIR